MKKRILGLISVLMFGAFVFSCATEAGTLPRKWWTMDRGKVQNEYRGSASGAEAQVVIFLGRSSRPTNVDESTAVENARMDAYQQLSRFLSQKVTGIQQSSRHVQIIDEKVAKGEITKEEGDSLIKKVSDKFANYQASITSTQFSSFKEEGQHVEYNSKLGHYEAWVAYSMSDQILKETRELQKQAFASLMTETEAYVAIMQEIQEMLAEQMKESIMDEAQM
ncbi:MAG: hypothetical protein JXR63_04640 [Spirochaetales bacterium]|nr:hypothetical protein [Spirochaetales bacterium]